jgi:hypothetical protein
MLEYELDPTGIELKRAVSFCVHDNGTSNQLKAWNLPLESKH